MTINDRMNNEQIDKITSLNERTSDTPIDTPIDKEKRMRYNVTTRGNCFLRGFADFQSAIDFCCNLDICAKIFDNCTGVTVDLGSKKIDQLKSQLSSKYGTSFDKSVYYDTDSIKVLGTYTIFKGTDI